MGSMYVVYIQVNHANVCVHTTFWPLMNLYFYQVYVKTYLLYYKRDFVILNKSLRYNHQCGSYLETRLIQYKAGFELGTLRSQGSRFAI